jgi:nicotinate-nucleotide adenylyltransferase
MKRIGLLGGSFNPAHRGHRRLSLAAIEALGLDEVWWLVSPGNPLKPQAGMAPYGARLASARATARRSKIRVSDFEARAETRFTIDTVTRLRRRYPTNRFIWLMGADILPHFHRWKAWRQLARTVPIAVVPRPGYSSSTLAARAMAWLRRFVRPARQAKHWTEWSAPAILLLRLPPDPTSATRIRALDPNWHLNADRSRHGTERAVVPSFPRRPLARPD